MNECSDFLKLVDGLEALLSRGTAEELQQIIDHACSWQVLLLIYLWIKGGTHCDDLSMHTVCNFGVNVAMLRMFLFLLKFWII